MHNWKQYLSKNWIVATVLLAGAFIPAAAFAHTTGASWEAKVDSYLVDVGYDTTVFTAGDSSRFDFNLFDEKTRAQEGFTHVWVRMIRDGTTLLATGIWHQPVGPTSLLYAFGEAGNYTLEVSFRDTDGNDIAVATFPITVVADSERSGKFSGSSLLFSFMAGVLIAGFGLLLATRRR